MLLRSKVWAILFKLLKANSIIIIITVPTYRFKTPALISIGCVLVRLCSIKLRSTFRVTRVWLLFCHFYLISSLKLLECLQLSMLCLSYPFEQLSLLTFPIFYWLHSCLLFHIQSLKFILNVVVLLLLCLYFLLLFSCFVLVSKGLVALLNFRYLLLLYLDTKLFLQLFHSHCRIVLLLPHLS